MCVPLLFKQVPFLKQTLCSCTLHVINQVIDWSQRSLLLYVVFIAVYAIQNIVIEDVIGFMM